MEGRIQMRKTTLFAIAAAVILAGVGAWTMLTTRAPVAEAALPGVQIDPSKMMMNAKRDLPAERFVDYSFVFN
jgi:hypothetical protein